MSTEGTSASPSDDKPASMGHVKAIIRRRIRKHVPHEEMSINIYPMMDMMTILLVFLVMQFATSSADIVQSDDLKIPYASVHDKEAPGLSIQISRGSITVDGRNVMGLTDGRVDPNQKRGGGNSFVIVPLLERLTVERKNAEQVSQMRVAAATTEAGRREAAFSGDVRIIADKRTQFRTLSEVIYTLGQSGYKNLHFVVLQSGTGS